MSENHDTLYFDNWYFFVLYSMYGTHHPLFYVWDTSPYFSFMRHIPLLSFYETHKSLFMSGTHHPNFHVWDTSPYCPYIRPIPYFPNIGHITLLFMYGTHPTTFHVWKACWEWIVFIFLKLIISFWIQQRNMKNETIVSKQHYFFKYRF